MVAVVADLCWKVKGYAQACLAVAEQVFEALVCLLCRSESCVLAHGPESRAIHRWIDASGEGKFPWKTQMLKVIDVCCFDGSVNSGYWYVGSCRKLAFFWKLVEAFQNCFSFPFLLAPNDFIQFLLVICQWEHLKARLSGKHKRIVGELHLPRSGCGTETDI